MSGRRLNMADDGDLDFRVKLRWDGKTGGTVYIDGRPRLRLDMPVDFGGGGKYPCPDEIFLSSIAGCLLTTFLYFKAKLHVQVEKFEVSVEGILGVRADGYEVERVDAHLFIESRDVDEANLRRCVELTRKYCHITRTLEKAFPIRIFEEIRTINS
ncbi:MAG: OsmC family protein [Candidatus Bathyarchaeia archaeon]